jgi:hypothetical protein
MLSVGGAARHGSCELWPSGIAAPRHDGPNDRELERIRDHARQAWHHVIYKGESMRLDKRLAVAFVFVLLTILSSAMARAGDCDYCVCKGKDTVNTCTKCCSNAQAGESTVTELRLRISDDGKSIVDQNGEEVARFVKGTQVQIKKTADKSTSADKSVSQKMQGCFKCRNVCVIWNGNKCVEWARTCDWDFDCK